jgi:hypothetical protein
MERSSLGRSALGKANLNRNGMYLFCPPVPFRVSGGSQKMLGNQKERLTEAEYEEQYLEATNVTLSQRHIGTTKGERLCSEFANQLERRTSVHIRSRSATPGDRPRAVDRSCAKKSDSRAKP